MSVTAERSLRDQWQTQSYVVVRRLIEPGEAARLRDLCEEILRQWFAGTDPSNEKPTAGPESTVMRHLNHPAYFTQRPGDFPVLMDLVADERVLAVAREVLADEPLFRCTSLFFNPQQNSRDGNWHRDTQFLTKTDDEEQRLLFGSERAHGLQLQIALVPSEDSEVVPGTHLRWDTPEEYRIRKEEGGRNNRSGDMPGAVRVRLEPGDAVAFNARALHRGRYHTDKLRRTLMLTYSTLSGIHPPDYFNRQPWFLEPGHLDPLQPRTRAFFERFIAEFRETW
jgi:ectoine hydroxylase-related dioxygenase (phytanoyl-CoA dioxygenase family)